MIYANGARSNIYYVNPKVIICYARFWTLKAYRYTLLMGGHRLEYKQLKTASYKGIIHSHTYSWVAIETPLKTHI